MDAVQGITYALDGSVLNAPWAFRYRFDAGIISPYGRYAVVYETLGTKGVVFDITLAPGDGFIREINRSYDNAEAFEYPVLMFQLPDGREAIAHCPVRPDCLVIENLTDGTPIAASAGRSFTSMDYYYSRLAANPSGTRIISTGWGWHPCTQIVMYDVQSVLDTPEKLDSDDAVFRTPTEPNSAAFLGNDMLVIAGALDPEYENDDSWLPAGGIALYDLNSRRWVSRASLDRTLGNVMPVSSRYVVEFHEHPKLIDIETAEVIHCWEDIDSGKQESSIIWHVDPLPPIALDPERHRFAVATGSSIRVVEVSGC